MLQKLDITVADLYLQGAHLTQFKDWLFLSSPSRLAEGKSIHGGIPVIFPWFGPKRDDANAPQHGWARTSLWHIESQSQSAITLSLNKDSWDIRLSYNFGDTLGINVKVENVGSETASFELALHTYFSVSDVRSVAIEGLNGLIYVVKTSNYERFTQTGAVRFQGEVDRIYLSAPSPLRILDGKTGYELSGDWKSAVTWNPGETKAATMSDMAEGAWQQFVCLEVGAIADDAIQLEPQATWEMSAEISRI